MKKVLIAHQSTIPHYRVAFYNALERLRPSDWTFDVVFDPVELKKPHFFNEPLDVDAFKFTILKVTTIFLKIFGKEIHYQTFWSIAGQYDLVIVGQTFKNLTYPLCILHHIAGHKIAFWGHGKDRAVDEPTDVKLFAEWVKRILARQANGVFAYTPGVKQYLESLGVDGQNIFVLNNTIDIVQQRTIFERFKLRRDKIKQDMGLQGKYIMLFVGRFTKNKRLDFLLEAFSLLQQKSRDFHLLVVGDGDIHINRNREDVSFLGTIVDIEKLGPIYTISDLFVFPGAIGLGPLQAFAYDLPVITVESTKHGPEFEYLTPSNSIVLDVSTTPEEYAQTVYDVMTCPERYNELQAGVWASIQHLTIDRMAQNFIQGVNHILE